MNNGLTPDEFRTLIKFILIITYFTATFGGNYWMLLHHNEQPRSFKEKYWDWFFLETHGLIIVNNVIAAFILVIMGLFFLFTFLHWVFA